MARSRRGGFVGFVYSLFSLVFIAALLGGGVAYFGLATFRSPGPLTQEAIVDIRTGDGLATIAAKLEQQGVITDDWVFVAGVFVYGVNDQLKAGEFSFPAHASMAEVMAILVEGKALLYKATIPEGLTSFEVVARLNAHESLEGSIADVPEEGTLLPETYNFQRGATRQQILGLMRSAQEKLLADLWAKRAPGLPFDSLEKALTLASIVEKETGRPEERRLVASVFINRLRRNMRLQSDPTIIYGITGGRGVLDRPILQSDIDKSTPYNTYQVDGLPPTPIANPGRASIEATLNPAETDYVYFVADGTGGHVFAATLAEHTHNVARWREVERERREAERRQQEQGTSGAQSPGTTAPAPAGEGALVETETEDLKLPGQ
jgi:UPF0755 protein